MCVNVLYVTVVRLYSSRILFYSIAASDCTPDAELQEINVAGGTGDEMEANGARTAPLLPALGGSANYNYTHFFYCTTCVSLTAQYCLVSLLHAEHLFCALRSFRLPFHSIPFQSVTIAFRFRSP